jgi:isocitrate dehydrogenase kinase/phosphatase
MPQNTFPKLLSSQIAFDIARTILDGFDKHYRLFREVTQNAKKHFEQANWPQAQIEAKERIGFYDTRAKECVQILEEEYQQDDLSDEVWREVKLHYMGLLIDHLRPELAETFFNTVCTKLLHRNYFHNDFIFVRPAAATEYIEREETPASYRVYYPSSEKLNDGLKFSLKRIVTNFQLKTPFANLDQDINKVAQNLELYLAKNLDESTIEPNHQLQVLASLFFRNKAAYILGKRVNGTHEIPFVIPIMHNKQGELVLDAILFDNEHISILFSFTRAYFMVDMVVPSCYVQFIRSILPRHPRSEIYTMLGLQKHGKNLFYRDFLHHLKYSSDMIQEAPGIRGLVMLVFALPSFPYVFKLIKDSFPPPKETTKAIIKEKYLLVKNHDRVGRMADTLEYSDVAFPRSRFSDSLLNEIIRYAPSMVEYSKNEVVIKHCYIERRMTPLNICLQDAEQRGDEAAIEHAIVEYGQAIKELIGANIFPGDMLYKNFGVTRHQRVVFYDYDEIEFMVDCNFRVIPEARNEEDEMSAEPWYPIARNDVFPEQFAPFLLGNPKIKKYFLKHHADLLTASYWQACKQRIVDGKMDDVFPYPQNIRFARSYSSQHE